VHCLGSMPKPSGRACRHTDAHSASPWPQVDRRTLGKKLTWIAPEIRESHSLSKPERHHTCCNLALPDLLPTYTMPRIDEDDYQLEEESFDASTSAPTYAADFPALSTTAPRPILDQVLTAIRQASPLPNDTLAAARHELNETIMDGAWGAVNKTSDASLAASLNTEATIADIRRFVQPHDLHQELLDSLQSSVRAATQAIADLAEAAAGTISKTYAGTARNSTQVLRSSLEEYHRDPESSWLPSPDLPWAVAITAITGAGLLALVASRWIYARRTATSATLIVSRPTYVADNVAKILSGDQDDDSPASTAGHCAIEMQHASVRTTSARLTSVGRTPRQQTDALPSVPETAVLMIAPANAAPPSTTDL
jgi:hypothetical protein